MARIPVEMTYALSDQDESLAVRLWGTHTEAERGDGGRLLWALLRTSEIPCWC